MQSLLSRRQTPRRPTFQDLLNQADSLPSAQCKRRPRSTSSHETLLMAKKKLGKQAKLKAKALKVVAAKGKAAAERAAADPGAHDPTHGEDQYYVDAEPDAHTSDHGEHSDRGREPPLAHGHGHPHHHAQHHPAQSHDTSAEQTNRSRPLSPQQERRGRSSRPRLLWASTLEPESLRVLDTHHKKAWGFRVPRMRGPGSEEGRLWSEELDRSGL